MRLLTYLILALVLIACTSPGCPSGTYIDESDEVVKCCSVQDNYVGCVSANANPKRSERADALDSLSKAALAAFIKQDLNSIKHLFESERMALIQGYAIEHAQTFGETIEFTLRHSTTESGLSQRYFRETHRDGLVHECAVLAHGFDGKPWKVVTVKCQGKSSRSDLREHSSLP